MNIRLNTYIQLGGSQVKSVDAVSIDWNKRVVFLGDNRWIPFENISVGEAEPIPAEAGSLEQSNKEYWDGIQPGHSIGSKPVTAHVCVGCSKPFDSAKAVKAHQRFCKAHV